jgi:glycosyltransferase involved in cell wall biosynthesis
MRLAIDVRRVRNFGIGTYIRNLTDALGEIDKQNEYVLVRSAGDEHEFPELPPNFRTVIYDHDDSDPRDHYAFPWFLRGLKADLVHFPLNRVPLLMPRPFVVTVHDMSSLLFEERTSFQQQLQLYRFRRGLLRADSVMVVSDATRRDVENLLDIDRARLRLVYNAPNPDFFRTPGPEVEAERQRVLERYQIQYPYLLYAGSIRPQKNVPRLIESFAVAREEFMHEERYAELRLIVIGDEISRYPQVRRAVIESRVENYVRFLGFVEFETLRCFYEGATAFVFPSLYEGFGLPPIEAMACGTPVITSMSSSLPEVVGNAAMLVNPENVFDIARGIKEVLFDPDLQRRLIAAGREHALKFSWKRTAQEVLKIYREVAGK